jgi:hypothetical protein
MDHTVDVPNRFRVGRGAVWVISDAEKYIDSYERSWWACMEDRGININYRCTDDDWIGNGWPSEVDGFRNGYIDANKLIEKNIRKFGREAVQRYLLDKTNLTDVPPEKRRAARFNE